MKFSDSKGVQLEQIWQNLRGGQDIELTIDPHRAFMLAMVVQQVLKQKNLLTDHAADDIRELAQGLIEALGEIDPQAKAFLEQNWKV